MLNMFCVKRYWFELAQRCFGGPCVDELMRNWRPIWRASGRRFSPLLAVAGLIALAGCNSSLSLLPDPQGPDVYDAVAQTDLRAKPGVVIGRNADIGSQAPPRGITFEGRELPAVGGRRGGGGGGGSAGGGEYNVDFDNTPIAAVAKSIIVDTLNLGLNVDPRVAGNISLSSGRALNRNELLLSLESALRTANASLVKDGASGYRIVPASETAGLGSIDRSRDPAPGFGISVLPLRFISADNMLKLIDSFAAKPGAIRVDSTRNLMIIQGTGDERRTTLETAAAFDQDWMRGQSVGVYPLGNASPETIITELQKILDAGEGGAYKGILQFQPIARMKLDRFEREVDVWHAEPRTDCIAHIPCFECGGGQVFVARIGIHQFGEQCLFVTGDPLQLAPLA